LKNELEKIKKIFLGDYNSLSSLEPDAEIKKKKKNSEITIQKVVEFDCDYALVKWLNKSEKNVYGVVSVDLIHHTDELVLGTTYKVSYNHKKFSATLVKLG
jgi:hypothetical protein